MINKLSKEQEALIPTYVNKWIGIGTSTEDVSTQEAESIVEDFRKLISYNEDAPFIWGENPIECWVLCCLHEQGVKFDDLQTKMKEVFNGSKEYIIPKAGLPFNDISLAATFSFYDYMIEVVGVPVEKDILEKYNVWKRTSALWAIYPLDTLTVVCRKPKYVKLNEDRVLHCDGGAALEFGGEGDFKVYALNGVSVPEYLATTPSHKLDIAKYHEESNADVKAEFVRKVGIESFLTTGKKVDTYEQYDQEDHNWWWKSEYELWDMKNLFPSLDYAPYLKMLNQTTGVWHMEGVSPVCRTLRDAIKERFGGREMRIVNVA